MSAQLNNEPYAFISYAHADKDCVLPIVKGIEAQGVNVWFDGKLDGGDSWTEEIAEKIENCVCMLAFVSPKYQESSNCIRELRFGSEENKTVIVIRIKDGEISSTELKYLISGIHCVNLSNYTDDKDFINAIVQNPHIRQCVGIRHDTESDEVKAFQTAKWLWDQKENGLALSVCEYLANRGYAEAQYELGVRYENGKGVERDSGKAMKWLLHATNHGHSDASQRLTPYIGKLMKMLSNEPKVREPGEQKFQEQIIRQR